MTRQGMITYSAAAGNIGLWIMAGILSEGGQLPAFAQLAIVGLSALALGLSMAFGLVEIAQKMATLPVEFERKHKDGSVKITPNRRYQVARLVLFVIIGGESFLLMPIVVALATKTILPEILPGAWLWLWSFGRVAASAALLAGLSAMLESGHKAEPSKSEADESKNKAEPRQAKANESKTEQNQEQTKAEPSGDVPLYTCSVCSWNSLEAERSGHNPLKAKNGHALKHKKAEKDDEK
jgi:hypothetical protein